MAVVTINDVQKGETNIVASFQFLTEDGEVLNGPNIWKKTVASLAYHLYFYLVQLLPFYIIFNRKSINTETTNIEYYVTFP